MAQAKAKSSSRGTKHSTLTRERYLVDAVRHYEALAKNAEEAGAFGPAVNAKKEAALCKAELDQLRETQARAKMPATRDLHEAELLAEVRRQRLAATGIAATKFLALEAKLLADAAAKESAAEEDRIAGATADELRAEAERLLAETKPALRVVK